MGEVPANWALKPGFTVIKERKIKNIGLKETIVLSLSYGEIVIKPEEKLTGLVPESFETYQLVDEGNIIIRPTDLQNDKVSLRTGLSKYRGIITSAYLNFVVRKHNSSSFYYYYLHALDITKILYQLGSGLRQNLDFNDFKRFPFVVPPLPEQTRIASFLDKKTAQIDQAIAQKERLIELLKERRQIMIHKAVTRGLNPDVKLKNSGVEWIGEIPEHWEVKSIRYAFEFLNTKRVPLSSVERESMQGRYPYYGASGIIDYVDDYIFDERLILIAEDGANLLSKSTPLAFSAEGKYWVNNHAHILRPKNPGFSFWEEQLSSINYVPWISGSAQPKLTKDRLGSIPIIVPPEDECAQLSDSLESMGREVAKVIALTSSQINQLKELKSTLINSAVTGKIKV